MVDKVNGMNQEGSWFERDVQWLTVVSSAADFALPWAVNGMPDKITQVIETRATVIGITDGADTNTAYYSLGSSAGSFETPPGLSGSTTNVLVELKALLDALSAATFTLTLGTGFKTFP